MPSGDEPMLPQPEHDHTPMISGVQTRVYADLRGAYQVGNLRALIERMDEPQALRFRQALMTQLNWTTVRGMLYGERGRIPAEFRARIEQWAEQPSEALVERIHALLFPRNLMLLPGLWSHTLLRLLRPHHQHDLYRTAQMALALWSEFTHEPLLGAISGDQLGAQQWQLDAAWAILRNRDLPPLPQPDYLQSTISFKASVFASVEARMASRYQGAFLPVHLDILLDRMSDDQLLRFRQALIRQALAILRRAIPPDDARLAEVVGAARQWLESPSREQAARFNEMAVSLVRADPRYHHYKLLDVSSVMRVITLNHAAWICRRLVGAAALDEPRDDRGLVGDEWGIGDDEEEAGLRRQIEAAWAILNGKEPSL